MHLDFFRQALRLIDALESKTNTTSSTRVIEEMNTSETQGGPSIEHLCALGRVSRAGFYRFGEFCEPKRAEADLRDKIQAVALNNRFYGSRRIGRELWRLHGLKIKHKHLRRLMREDNLLRLRQKPFVP
jgi:putative transposase